MNEYTSSNGTAVRLDELGDLDISNKSGWIALCGGHVVDALREFFRAEEDERLERWRWPENPDYVVYLRDDGQAMVFIESTGHTVYRYRGEADELRRMRAEHGDDITPATRAAEAYFDAHPEPKPWHNAKPGEVWVLTTENVGDEVAARVADLNEQIIFEYVRGLAKFDITDPRIVTGRRIWPEPS